MKRGRPHIRDIIQTSIIETLSSSSTPLTVSALAKIVSAKLNKTVSWNTVEKYLIELAGADKVRPIPLPHSKIEGKIGLTVYQLKNNKQDS